MMIEEEEKNRLMFVLSPQTYEHEFHTINLGFNLVHDEHMWANGVGLVGLFEIN
jgi:hypothetical protein